MSKTLKLWVDADTGFLYQSFNSSSSLSKIEFLQGDGVQVEVHMVKILNGFMSEVDFPTGSVLRMAIGKIDASATSGTYTISYGGDTTAPILFSATEAQIQTALNALASITSAGGVTVAKFSNSLYKVSFNQVGVRTLFTIDGSLLTPPCSTRSVSLKAGSVTDKGEFLIKVKQSPVAFQNSFEDIDPPSITATVLMANQSKRVTISPEPKGGTWAITGTGDLQRKVQLSNDGLLDPAWWDENYTARVSVNAFSSDTQFTYLNYDVVKVDSYTWDFSLKSYATPPVGYTMPFTVSGSGLIGYSGKIGYLDLNTAEVEYLLNGASTVTTNLELELDVDGNKKTLLQTTCTIKNDLIDQNNYSPISYGGNILWGDIGGTISNQTDLQSALDGKLSLTGGTLTGGITLTGAYENPANKIIFTDSNGVGSTTYDGYGIHFGDGSFWTWEEGLTARGLIITSSGVTFPDYSVQETAGLPLTGGNVTGDVQINANLLIGGNPTFDQLWISNEFISFQADLVRLDENGISLTGGNGFITFADSSVQSTAGLPLLGGTLTGKLNLNVEGTTTAPLNIKTGITPTTPLAGDVWIATDSFNYRNTSGVTRTVATLGNNNPFTNYQSITVGSNTNPALAVTQTGTADAFVVNDSSPDSTPFRIDANGRVGIGIAPDGTVALNVDSTGIKFNSSATAQTVPYIASDVLLKADNLSGLANASTARTNLGLGTMAVETATNYLTTANASSTYLTQSNATTTYYPLTNPSAYITSSALTPYAPLAGATFTGKVNIGAGATTSPLNIGAGVSPSGAGTAGDIWIGGTNLAYKDSTNTLRTTVTTSQSNTFTNFQTITQGNASNPSLAVTQTGAGGGVLVTNTGAGYSFKVEDSTSPDATPFAIDQNGRTGIGVAPDATVALTLDSTGIKVNGATLVPASTVTNSPITSGNMSHSEYTKELLITINGVNYAIVLRAV